LTVSYPDLAFLGGVLEYNIATNAVIQRTDVSTEGPTIVAASADGNTALAYNRIWHAQSDSFSPTLLTVGSGLENYSRSLSTDGYVVADFLVTLGQGGDLRGIFGNQTPIYNDVKANTILGEKVNATGSLAYLPETDRIRIYDIRHNKLIKTIMIAGGLNTGVADGLVVDPDGQVLYVLTNTGLTTLTFAKDPLAIGEVQVSGSQLTILGSGFAPEAVVQLDGSVISSAVTDSQHILATVTGLATGSHNITIILPSGESYSLDDALDVSSVN
jgi:hypothetical protein